jgi:hypothetical protein
MDYDLQFDPRHRVLLITLGKVVTEASASATYTAVERFIAAEGPCSAIADLSAIERADVHGYFVRSLASRPRAIPAGMPLILVAPQLVIYGLSRMFQLLRDEMEGYQIVRRREEAFALLSLEPRDFLAVNASCLVAAR